MHLNSLDDGGSERPEGASRATDADSAPWGLAGVLPHPH